MVLINAYVQVDKAQYERVLSYIEHGKREGATLLTGGTPCGQKGYYIQPAVFTNVNVRKIYDNCTSAMAFFTV